MTRIRTRSIVCALLVPIATLAIAGCSGAASSSGASSDSGAAPAVDMTSETCSDWEQLPSSAQIAGDKVNLRVMTSNEGLTVTTDMQNAYIAQFNSMCDSSPTALVASAASQAYVAVTGGN